MATFGDQKCFLPICSKSGQLSTFKQKAVKKLIECAVEHGDHELHDKLQSILNSHGEKASIELHKNCYCSYTSKDHIKKLVSRKRKTSEADITEAPTARVRRSQVGDFQFKNHCLFCAKVCEPINPKHPDRWEKVVQCERRGIKDAAPFKDAVLQYCGNRNDEWGREVAIRCHGAYDLAAVEAQYHLRCYNEFRKPLNNSIDVILYDDEAMKLLADEMYANQKHCTWSSIELYDKYLGYGGQLERRQLFTKLVTSLGSDAIVLNIEGCASIVGFREYVSKMFKLTNVNSVDEEKEDELVRKIKSESHSIVSSSKSYDVGDFTHDKAKQHTSVTLLRIISKLVSNGDVTKKSLSLSQSIQHCITSARNQTALGLAIQLHHKFGSRDLIDILHDHGYIVPYDEVLRFRKSAAKYVEENATTLHQMMGLTETVGSIFGWYDNFDLLVSTPNGRRETHAMATEFQMHPHNGSIQPGISALEFPRLTMQQAKFVGKNRAIPLIHYAGPKQVKPPAMLTHKMQMGIPYADVRARQMSLMAAQEADVLWLNSLSNGSEAIEWNGFNNQLSRTQGALKPATTYMFGPLIDAPPSHPDTILTTLTYMQKSLTDMGMKHIHLTMDMQLFAVTKQVCWNQPSLFQNVIIHPGGMHIMQSFIGCIGKLMKSSGLEVYVAAAYGGLTGIFNGKSWVKAMRAFRGVSAALLKRFLSTGPKTLEQIEKYLDTACLHPTGRHWVYNFLLPTLLVHQFERAEREGNVHLKQVTLEHMMKYFFLAGHVQYARYLTQYLLEMRALDTENKVDLVCRHHAGYWNAVSADQFGEQTAIKMGKGSLRGMTLSPELVSEWIDAFPITVHVSQAVDTMYSSHTPEFKQKQHKEEQKHRRLVDAEDRSMIAAEVEKYPHPLEDSKIHLYNPITGQVAPADVNVMDSFFIGEKMERAYIATLPEGFHNPISSPIKTMSIIKKQAKGSKVRPVIDLESMFLRLLMIGQQRQIKLEHLFTYELCSVPSSLLDEHSCLRKANKSALVKRLGVLDFLPTTPETVVVDVSQLFYHTVWPHGGTLSDLIACIQSKISRYPDATEKIIVFDKYNGISAKDHERMRRAGVVVVDYELSITSPLPKRDAILKSKSNKRQLASVLCTFSMDNNVTMETRDDGAFSHDEADVTIVSYIIQAASHGKSVIRVLSDDTDVFVLLVYWVHRAGLQCKVQMERWDGTVVDINATCADLGEKCLQLLGMHALSGCDTVSYPYGKGKISALNTLLTGDFPGLAHELGEVEATHTDLMEAAQTYFWPLYRQPSGTSMENARFKLFTKKKKTTKIMALPPTSANLLLHVLRAHLQVMLWKAADQQAPPDQSLDITHFGWIIQNDIPIPEVAPGAPAPPELVDLIKCSCKAQGKRCSSEACSCHKKHVPCTSYCNCSGGEDCCNPHSVRPGTSSEEDENEADDDYFESDTVIEDEEEGESGDIHDDNCVITAEDFELDIL